MLINIDETSRCVHGISPLKLIKIKAYLQGAVYCWCKNRKGEWFAARDILGGDNYFWEGTPMFELYRLFLDDDESNMEYAVEEAGKAAGHLLKRVIIEDNRVFETRVGYTREYRWTGQVKDDIV